MNRLLLLEDDESLIDGLVYALEKQGFFLSVARSLLEGKRKLKGEKAFDLLLFDVTLPDGSAFELCETLRREENFTPIIFLTASDEETSIIRGLDCGGDDYITKPFRFLYKGIIINHNKKLSQPTLKRRYSKKKAAFFSWPGLRKEWY